MSDDPTKSGHFPYGPKTRDDALVPKLAGLVEILLIVGASIALALAAQQVITPGLGQTLGLATASEPDFLASALVLAKQFALQYGGLLILVVILAFMRARRSPKSYGLSRGNRPLKELVLIGLVGGAFAAIPTEAIFLLKEVYPLGADTPIWTVVENAQWDWRFWVFMAVGSFVMVPVLEEATWRGYVLGRLVENFRPGAALVVTAIAFGLLHVQYLASGDLLGYLTLTSVIFAALVYGTLTLWTGSLLPAIIAHIMINTPKSFEVGIVVLCAYLLIAFVAHRQILRLSGAILKSAVSKDTVIALALIVLLTGLGIAAATFKTAGLLVFAGACLVCTVANAILRRSAWKN